MPQLLGFLYCSALLILYSGVIAFAFCLNQLRKDRFAAPVVGLFSFFLLDNLVISMAEHVPSFAEWYAQTFILSPAIKSVIFLGIAFFTFRCWNTLVGKGFSPPQIAAMISLGLWLFFVPLIGSGALVSWLYFTGYQIFNITLCLYGLRSLRNMSTAELDGPTDWIRKLLIIVTLMSLVIIAEDAFVIFRIDNYIGKPSIFNRSVSEDILRIIYIGFAVYIFKKQLYEILPSPHTDAGEAAAESDPGSEISETDVQKLRYAQHLGLTRREEEVLLLLLDEKNNTEISEALHISLGTVKVHIHNIFQKAYVSQRIELIRQYETFQAES